MGRQNLAQRGVNTATRYSWNEIFTSLTKKYSTNKNYPYINYYNSQLTSIHYSKKHNYDLFEGYFINKMKCNVLP